MGKYSYDSFRKSALTLEYQFDPYYSLQGDDYIELSNSKSDSSFHIRFDKSNPAGKITIGTEELKRQKNKELTLELVLYRKNNLKAATPEGGTIEIEYRLKPISIKLED
jgi:hypothetical protein